MSADERGALRVCHLIDSLVTGGAERLLVSFAEAVAARADMELFVFVLTDAETPFRARIEGLGVTVVPLPGRTLLDPRRFLRLHRALAAHRIEVLHAHLSASIILGSAAARIRNIPFVATVHNVKPSTRRVGGLRRRLYDRALGSPRTWRIAVGKHVAIAAARDVPGDYQVIPNAVHPNVIWTGTEDRAVARRELGFENGDIGLIAVGLIIGQKGYPDLIEAIARIAPAHPQVKLAILGATGWEELRAGLDAQIIEAGLSDRVRFMGLRTDVSRLLAASDVFVSASHWEGAPVSLLEAMANGLPCVVTAVGDNCETLQDTGAPVTPAGQPDIFARALESLVVDSALRARISDAMRRRIATKFGTDIWLDQLSEVYRGTWPQSCYNPNRSGSEARVLP